jgi:hypothetical protein
MKQLKKSVLQFIKKEWFLIITLTAITIIILLFETL